MARRAPKWNNKNSWMNYRTATNATIRAATSLDNTKANGTYGGKSKGIGSGTGGMDALTAVQNIVEAHGVDVAGWVADYYDDDYFEAMAVKMLGLEGIPWRNGIYDKDRDGIDFEEEVEALMELMPDMIAEQWLSGDLYMPSDFCDYCFYEVSDHNR
jgi:hypothetical protein